MHDLNRRNKGPDLLLDSLYIRKDRWKKFASAIRNSSNFMKHADRGKAGKTKTLEFYPESTVGLIMFTIFGLKYLGEKLGPEEIAFEWWQLIQEPDTITDDTKVTLEKLFTIDALRAIQKHKFLEFVREAIDQAPIGTLGT